jgi:hypothetical protein
MINYCGVIAGTIKKKACSINDIINAMANCKTDNIDLSRKNHFLNAYDNNDEWIIVLHSSFDYVKNGNEIMPGLYPKKDSFFYLNSHLYHGKYGEYNFVTDNIAKKYREVATEYDIICKIERERKMKSLFNKIDIIFNKSHMLIPDKNLICIGCYYSQNNDILVQTEGPGRCMILKNFSRYYSEIGCYLEPHGSGIDFEWDDLQILNNKFIFNQNGVYSIFKNIEDVPKNYKKINNGEKIECIVSGKI